MTVKKINKTNRTVELSFMSETPVPREYNGKVLNEILVVTNKTVNIDRLINDGPVLFNHDFAEPIGKIMKAWIDDEERKGRAIVRFGSVGKAGEIFSLIEEGILSKVSVGYTVTDGYVSGDNFYCTEINCHEISIVSVPADDAVGIGRALNTDVKNTQPEKEKTMSDESLNKDVEETESTEERAETVKVEKEESIQKEETVEVEKETDEAEETEEEVEEEEVEEEVEDEELREMKAELEEVRKATILDSKKRSIQIELNNMKELRREAEIKSIAEAFNVEIPDDKYITVDEFKRSLTNQTQNQTNINKEDNNMSIQNKALLNAVRTLKGEALLSDELVNDPFNGGGVLTDARVLTATRAQDFTGLETGAGDIQTAYDSVVDALFPKTLISKLGIERRAGAGRALTIPVLDNMGTNNQLGKFLAEGEAVTDDWGTFKSVTLLPERFSGAIVESKSVMLVAPTIQADLNNAMQKRMAKGLESEIFKRVLAEAPTAEVETDGTVTSVDIETAVYTLASKNVDITSVKAVCSPKVYQLLRNSAPLSNTINQGIIASGYQYGEGFWLNQEVQVFPSTLIEDDVILFGQWEHFLLVDWQTASVTYDIYTLIAKNQVRIQEDTYLSTYVKHPEAFLALSLKKA